MIINRSLHRLHVWMVPGLGGSGDAWDNKEGFVRFGVGVKTGVELKLM